MSHGVRTNKHHEIVATIQWGSGMAKPEGVELIAPEDYARVCVEMTRLGKPRWKRDPKTGVVTKV
jgi:hypothetical protein